MEVVSVNPSNENEVRHLWPYHRAPERPSQCAIPFEVDDAIVPSVAQLGTILGSLRWPLVEDANICANLFHDTLEKHPGRLLFQ
jgi:hypothetical protein